ncbi:MAG TPA: M36 family metallopeptidase, partial [Vicinamibacteria bacterium]
MRRSLGVLGLLLALGVADAQALQKPSSRDRVRPDFDSRLGRGRGAAPLAGQPITERLDLLRSRFGSRLRTRAHPLTGSVRLLWADGEALSEAGPDPLLTTRRFLQENAALLGLDPAQAGGLVVTREDAPVGGALRRLLFEQVVDGVPVFEGVVFVHLDRLGRVVRLAAGPLHRGPGARATAPVPTLSAEEALERAIADVRPELKVSPRRRAGSAAGSRAIAFDAGPLKSEASAELFWFPTADGDRLAWKVTVDPGGFPQVYDILVDAENGAVLYRRNRVRYADGTGTVPQSDETALLDPRRPDEHPAGANPSGAVDPPGGCPPVDGYLSRSLNAPFRDPASVLAASGRLQGNNTSVYRTSNGIFGALGTLDAGAWRFDYPFGSPASVETALFFSTNFAHDFFYDLGFDEGSGNFQVNNFGRGGVGGDSLRTLARATGRNNATFEPAPEGQSPIMSLFLFDGAGCWQADLDADGSSDLDGGYDRDVVIHEYHHGVSLRLNPAFTGPEADAMGEGGGD